MKVQFLKITDFYCKNFRNLDFEPINFSEKINCILGNNGNGKTNLLEAVHYSLAHKTFKKNTGFEQIINLDGEKPEAFLKLKTINKSLIKTNYSLLINSDKIVQFKNDTKLQTRQRSAVFFVGPFDSHTFHCIPKERRAWFDQVISIFDLAYGDLFRKHNQLIKLRNKILSENYEDKTKRTQINAIDKELSKIIPKIIKTRRLFVDAMQLSYRSLFKKIFSAEHEISIQYSTKFKDLSEEFVYNFLQSSLLKDRILGYTSYSVHKDDYSLLLNGFNSLDYASLGQQKISYMSLFFAALEMFKEKYEDYPVLLIDDMSSELDNERWQGLLKYLMDVDIQVFITTANENFLAKMKDIKHSRCYKVESGKIFLIN